MRIEVNLATHRYQDARDFYARWGTALGLVLVITLGLAFVAWGAYKNASADTKRIRELKNQIARLEEERTNDLAVLNRPENKDVRDQSQFWNDVIDQKAFSWTQLFSDLEKIMPARAYVVHAEPSFTKERQLQLRLLFVGEKHDDAVELLRNMERSERFRSPSLTAEEVRTSGNGPAAAQQTLVQFEIMTYYNPALPLRPVSPKEGSANAKNG